MARILIVEDEDKLRRVLRLGLEQEGFEVQAAADGDEGLALALGGSFDCLILDLSLPGCDGLELLNRLRAANMRTPTLILTARGEIEDRVTGLDAGADDYLTKPFAWAELSARVRACLRRGEAGGETGLVLRAGGLELDRVRRELVRGEIRVELTAREFELLEYLVRHKGTVVTREQLARDVWRDAETELTNVIDVYINYVRKKLDRAGEPGLIATVRGQGYSLRG